jgi:ABC-type phosphate/phosphonate transport system substrate-binding protein
MFHGSWLKQPISSAARSVLVAPIFVLSFIATQASAASQCEDLFSRQVSDFEELGLESPEIEAKFLVRSRKIFAELKALIGDEIKLRDATGREIVYIVEKDKEHIYEDVLFDTADLALFQSRGLLRQRVRYDRKSSDHEYKFRKAVFQAKNGPADTSVMSSAIFARDEIRGEEFKKKRKFLKSRDKRLGTNSDDAAVRFARDRIVADQDLSPVLKIRDKRFFMLFKTSGEDDPRFPKFYVSLDDVKYRGLVGKEKKASRLELEIEIIGDLSLDTPSIARQKLDFLNQLAAQLMARYELVPSPESKYESGVKLTILPAISARP